MMDDLELLTVIKTQLSDTIKYANSDFKKEYKAMLDSYNQEKYGNEEEGRSQVVSSDHYDMVESDMPALARIFLGANKVMQFTPLNNDDKEEAEHKTIYADWVIRQQKDSFKIIHDWIKEPGFSKCAVVKYYCEEVEKPEYHAYKGLNEDELALVTEDLESQDKVDRVEIATQDEDDEGRFNIRFRVIKKRKKLSIVNVPPESFIFSRGAKSKEEAMLVGDECIKTKGELIADGFDKKLVKSLQPNKDPNGWDATQQRFENQGGWDYKSGYHWTQETVTIQNLYALVDYDEDGIPERRFIMKCGEVILENEPYGIAPYAILSQVLMPHAAIGKSRGEQAQRYQKEKTAIKRGVMDNIYSVTRTRYAVDDSGGTIEGGTVDLDDLSNQALGGYVRCDGDPSTRLMPLVTPYIGDGALQVVQYIDTEKANSLGNMLTNQGLTADKFYKETATRFEGIEEAGQAKIELVARVYAETGFRDLYEGVIWTAQHYQDDEAEIMVLGEPMIVDPRNWKYEHYCQSQVGLGAGDSAGAIDNLGAMLNTQLTLMGVQSPLVDSKKVYNTLDDLARALGKPDTSRYYNDPEVEQQQLLYMVEKLMKDNQMLMQQVQQNSAFAEPEKIRAEAKLIEAQSKQEIEAAKLSNQQQQFMEEMAQKQRQFMTDFARQMTELELKYKQDVPGSTV